MRLNIKPLTVNQAWQGKRYKTPKYNKYINDVCMLLKPLEIPQGYLQLYIIFGLSSKNADIDNPIKCFVDCLQKKYGFNDRMIKRLIVEVDNCKKGDEYIEFSIEPLK